MKRKGYTMAEELKASELITLKQAAQYCGLSVDFLRVLAEKGRLKAWKLGHIWVTTKADVDEYIASRKKIGAYREDIGA